MVGAARSGQMNHLGQKGGREKKSFPTMSCSLINDGVDDDVVFHHITVWRRALSAASLCLYEDISAALG